MKKLYIFFLPLMMLFSEAQAQEVELGAKAGMNVSNLGKSGYLARIGYHVGGTAEFITTPFFSIQTELVYSLQGAAIDRTQNIYLNYHYLNLPVLAKAYFYEDASFEIGMQYGFLMKAVNRSDVYTDEITSQVNRNDFAAVFGLNYKLGDSFNFGLRYNLGITNTQKQDVIYENRRTNRVLHISFGLVF